MVKGGVKRSLADQTYSMIIKKIQNGELKEGQRINIEELSKEFGVSRTPFREAVGRLIQNGFIESKHNVGPSVACFDKKKATDLIQANSILLESVMKLIFEDEEVEGLADLLQAAVDKQKDAYERDDSQEFFMSSVLFNEELLNACPNRKLAQFTEETQIQMDAWVLSYQENDLAKRISMEQHQELIELMLARKYDEFITLLKKHNSVPLEYYKNKI